MMGWECKDLKINEKYIFYYKNEFLNLIFLPYTLNFYEAYYIFFFTRNIILRITNRMI